MDKIDLKEKDEETSSSIIPAKRSKPSSDYSSEPSLSFSSSPSSSSSRLPPNSQSRNSTQTRIPIPLLPLSSSGPTKRSVNSYQPASKSKIPNIPSLPSNQVHRHHTSIDHPHPSSASNPSLKPPCQKATKINTFIIKSHYHRLFTRRPLRRRAFA